MQKSFLLLLFIPLLILFNKDIVSVSPVTIEGVVLSADTNKPLREIYVYTAKGEEEALTNDKGEFSITTWQSFPLTLTVQHQAYEEKKITISSPPKKLQILLKRK